MSWWRQNWRWLLIVGGVVLGIIVVLIIRLARGKKPAALLEAKLVMAEAKAKAAGVEGDKRVKEAKLGANDKEVQRLQDKLFTIKQDTKQKLTKIDGLDAEQLAKAFQDLGY
ncbi:MAG: hypothetical protein KC492_34190 [Myxococcales bacterium]|nr:hypothetical protein [Myxococcales bacterium]